jgi:hypothetical protein
MSQRITPYWIGSVAHLPLPPKCLSTVPDDTANHYGSMPVQKPLAKVLPLIIPTKKDVPQP